MVCRARVEVSESDVRCPLRGGHHLMTNIACFLLQRGLQYMNSPTYHSLPGTTRKLRLRHRESPIQLQSQRFFKRPHLTVLGMQRSIADSYPYRPRCLLPREKMLHRRRWCTWHRRLRPHNIAHTPEAAPFVQSNLSRRTTNAVVVELKCMTSLGRLPCTVSPRGRAIFSPALKFKQCSH